MIGPTSTCFAFGDPPSGVVKAGGGVGKAGGRVSPRKALVEVRERLTDLRLLGPGIGWPDPNRRCGCECVFVRVGGWMGGCGCGRRTQGVSICDSA